MSHMITNIRLIKTCIRRKLFANRLLHAVLLFGIAIPAIANEGPLSLKFEARIDRVSGVADELIPDSMVIGTELSGEIAIGPSRRSPIGSGNRWEWLMPDVR